MRACGIARHDRAAFQQRFAGVDRQVAFVPVAAVALDAVLLQDRHDGVGEVDFGGWFLGASVAGEAGRSAARRRRRLGVGNGESSIDAWPGCVLSPDGFIISGLWDVAVLST